MRTIGLAILVALLTAFVEIAKAQSYSTYNWESSPKVTLVSKEEAEHPAVAGQCPAASAPTVI